VEKVGTGTLTLSGNNIYQGTTTVTGGKLLVNGTHQAGAAYTVASGGTLGGAGTINSSTGGVDNANLNAGVTVQAGGKLAPGASAAGTLHMDLGTGALDISGAVDATNSQSMKFRLDTPTNSDQVQLLNSSNLSIGTGKLEFDDFAFTNLGGLAAGTYTLFDTSTAITGTLGSNLSGSIGAFNGTLALGDSGNDIVLNVTAGGPQGDWNGDGKVNAADYATWRKDPTNHGNDPGGYASWRSNFDQAASAGPGLAPASVPEPNAFVLVAAALACSSLGARRNRSCKGF
jgi:autotransporter-associated beta strand protein